jgi:hypothetical protein
MRAALVTANAAAGVVAALYAVLLWRRRALTPLAGSLALIMAGVAEWSLATSASVAAPTSTLAYAFNYAVYPGVAMVVAAFYLHARVFAGHPDLPPRYRALLLVHPVLLVAVLATDQWHHTFFQQMESTADIGFVPHLGPAYWVHTAYSYALLALGAALVVRAMRRAVRGQRRIFVLFLLTALHRRLRHPQRVRKRFLVGPHRRHGGKSGPRIRRDGGHSALPAGREIPRVAGLCRVLPARVGNAERRDEPCR